MFKDGQIFCPCNPQSSLWIKFWRNWRPISLFFYLFYSKNYANFENISLLPRRCNLFKWLISWISCDYFSAQNEINFVSNFYKSKMNVPKGKFWWIVFKKSFNNFSILCFDAFNQQKNRSFNWINKILNFLLAITVALDVAFSCICFSFHNMLWTQKLNRSLFVIKNIST